MQKTTVNVNTYPHSEAVEKHLDHVSAYGIIEVLQALGTSAVITTTDEKVKTQALPNDVDIVCRGYSRNADISELRRALIEYKLFDTEELAESSLISDYALDTSLITFNNQQACDEFCAWFISAESQLEQSALFARYARYDGVNWSALLLDWALLAFARKKGYRIGIIRGVK